MAMRILWTKMGHSGILSAMDGIAFCPNILFHFIIVLVNFLLFFILISFFCRNRIPTLTLHCCSFVLQINWQGCKISHFINIYFTVDHWHVANNTPLFLLKIYSKSLIKSASISNFILMSCVFISFYNFKY